MEEKGNGIFSEEFRLRISDYTTYDHLTPHAVLDLFQDVAGKHADLIGVGFQKMIEKDLIWVLVRTKYEVLKNPELYETVRVSTWPKDKGKLDFDREYLIENQKGEVLIRGISKWVVVNSTTRRISLARDVHYNCELEKREYFPGAFPKLEDFDIADLPFYEERTTFSDLDHNGHVNNANYARFILNSIALQPDEEIAFFEIDHIKELPPNTFVKNFYKKDGKIILVKGIIDNGDTTYIAKIVLK